jgi:hypothetical protein
MKRKTIIVLAAFICCLAFGSSASAASRVGACFGYQGVRYTGLSTSIQYHTTSGSWAYLAGSNARTLSDGCVTYNITGRYRNWHLRIKATAVVPEWRGFFVGVTPYYGPSGYGRYYLGQGTLQLWVLPATVPTAPSGGNGLTSTWLDQMTPGSGNSPCGSYANPAMQVACYMDAHGMRGNVVVLPRDFDNDGVNDGSDRYPNDSRYY